MSLREIDYRHRMNACPHDAIGAPPRGSLLRRLAADTGGNTLMIIAGALLPLLAIVGGGFDIGRAYIIQSRLQQACDAGVLIARKSMGPEAATAGTISAKAVDLGNRFFNANFGPNFYGSTNRSFTMTLGDEFEIKGTASTKLPTIIMKVFGHRNLDVLVKCSAQINYSNTDIMMVLDVTGSMAMTNPGDTAPRIDVLKSTIRTFRSQLAASSKAGSRIRYGFVPYSTNVNVGGLLKDEWVVPEWLYQSRVLRETGGNGTQTYYTASMPVSGSSTTVQHSTYKATLSGGTYSCPTKPANTVTTSTVLVGTTSTAVAGPPAGTKTVKTYRYTQNGDSYSVSLDGSVCTVNRTVNNNYVLTFDEVTEPSYSNGKWDYARLGRNVADWRTSGNGCIEERQTYEITNYDNVDFNKALDLNLDLVPTTSTTGLTVVESLTGQVLGSGNGGLPELLNKTVPNHYATMWRPMMPYVTYFRAKKWDGGGQFQSRAKLNTADEYISPALLDTAACPAPAAKLATFTEAQLDTYLAKLTPKGSTYHDIGMIWGGRLISPTGLFAAENGDASATSPTKRHLLFMTDGETSPLDLSYSSYGLEPIDQRRWSPSSSLTLTQVVEKRTGVACAEIKKRGVTVWVIGFGTQLNQTLKSCAGEGHYFEAANAVELNAAFAKVARNVAELRIVQ